MKALDSGISRALVASQFDLGKTTIYEWQQRRQETGDFQALKPGSAGYGHKVKDWGAFKIFAEAHGHKTQAEMAEAWEGQISRQTLSRCLQQIDFTRKKRPMDTKNGMMSNGHRLKRY
jgi:transposase